MRLLKFLTVLLISVSLFACSSNSKDKNKQELAQQQVEELYQKGKSAINKGNYNFAIDYYQALVTNYPYGQYTEQAKLDLIFAYDKTSRTEEAISAADDFINLYPTHRNVDYAYYMKGVASFTKKESRLENFIKGNESSVRDPSPLKDSEAAFEALIKRYPNSKYTPDAKQRIVFIRNELANRELRIANYYFDTEAYVAAANRCKHIIYRYETTPAVEGALILLEKAYLEMGLNDLASSTHNVLVENFPSYQDTEFKPQKKGFFNRLFGRD